MSKAEGSRFVSLEGGEGAGKSTLQAGLAKALRDRGLDVVETREPGGSPLADLVRGLALTPPRGEAWPALSEAYLMNAARRDHLEKTVRPALERGAWVVCDRFMDSTRAYQAGGVADAFLKALERETVGETRPDLTLILDAPPDALTGRRSARGGTDAFEARDAAFHAAVRQRFLAIAAAEPERCAVIDARQDADAVLADALGLIEQRLGAGLAR